MKLIIYALLFVLVCSIASAQVYQYQNDYLNFDTGKLRQTSYTTSYYKNAPTYSSSSYYNDAQLRHWHYTDNAYQRRVQQEYHDWIDDYYDANKDYQEDIRYKVRSNYYHNENNYNQYRFEYSHNQYWDDTFNPNDNSYNNHYYDHDPSYYKVYEDNYGYYTVMNGQKYYHKVKFR